MADTQNAVALGYEYRENDFVFTSNDHKSTGSMTLKGDLVWRSRGFAIESYRDKPKVGLGDANCLKKSNLNYLIVNCTGNVILRTLTQEEKVQLIEYQLDHISKCSATDPLG